MTKRTTIAAVNQALKAAGHSETLVKGRGYFYFADGEASNWRATSVYVYRITDLTVEQWVAERNELAQGAF
jgi:hypothetical protein